MFYYARTYRILIIGERATGVNSPDCWLSELPSSNMQPHNNEKSKTLKILDTVQ